MASGKLIDQTELATFAKQAQSRNPIVLLTDVCYNYGEKDAWAAASSPASLSEQNAEERESVQEKWALRNVSLSIFEGERLAIVGANGSGKSTLARLIAALEAPDLGKVELFSEACFEDGLPHGEAYAEARKKTAMVFQEPEDQIVGMTVEDDIVFGPENLRFSREKIQTVLDESLKCFGLSNLRNANPTTLSGGQQQKLVLASALAMQPRLLILDESASHLDSATRKTLFTPIRDLSITTVFITHSIEEAFFADRALVLKDGEAVALDSPEKVFSDPRKMREFGLRIPYAQQLALALEERGHEVLQTVDESRFVDALKQKMARKQMGCNYERGSKREATGTSCPQSHVSPSKQEGSNQHPHAAVRQQEAGNQHPHAPACQQEGSNQRLQTLGQQKQAITINNLSFAYKADDASSSREILKDVSFRVSPATVCALIGETGAGKTTLLKAIAGFLPEYEGEILVNGEAPVFLTSFLHRKKRRKDWSSKVGYVMQAPERQLFAETVLQDVEYGPLNLGFSAKAAERHAMEALEDLGVVRLSNASPFELSTGQARLVAIAGILAMGPDVLAFDEPFSGLDYVATQRLQRTLTNLAKSGKTVLFTTHDMNDAALANIVVLLAENTIQLASPPKDFFANETIRSKFSVELPWTMQIAEKLLGKNHPYPCNIDELADEVLKAVTCSEPSARS